MSVGLTFPTGSRAGAEQCVNVSITDDGDALEGDKAFTVALTTADTVVLMGTMATITITDSNGNVWAGCWVCSHRE